MAKLARLSAQLKAAGLATRTTARDRTRSVRRRAHAIGAWLRRRSDDAKEDAKAITGEMAAIAVLAVADARHVALNARRGLRSKGLSASGRAAAMVAELEVLDDGRGLSPGWQAGVGLCSMRERVGELGGSLSIGAGECGRGTRVVAQGQSPRRSQREGGRPAGLRRR